MAQTVPASSSSGSVDIAIILCVLTEGCHNYTVVAGYGLYRRCGLYLGMGYGLHVQYGASLSFNEEGFDCIPIR